jgi:diguanylate cyclase
MGSLNDSVRILFIDREQGEYLLVAELLSHIRHVDYDLVWCDSLAEALPLLLGDEFDVALLDYYWGRDSARDLLSVARVHACKTPIVLMTDEIETHVDEEAIRAGAADYLIKDQIDAPLLERTLRYAIERKSMEQHLAHLAHYDSLTNIPNRILFRDRLEHAILLAERDGTNFSLMFIDLNGFKQVNDNFGHDAGDEIIKICAQRLSMCLRRSDLVARMGGDEFTLLMQNTDNNRDVALIAEKVIQSISLPALVKGFELVVGCSIGIAVYPQAGRDADSLLKHADMAMYKAKQDTENHYRFFTESMNKDVKRQLRMEADLRLALKKQQFVLHYQPRIDVNTGKLIAVEALLRWNKPGVGLINASEFIEAAEETGVITSIGYWVIRQACFDLKRLHQSFDASLVMAINMSLKQFRDENLVHEVGRIFGDFDINPGEIEFEISETAFAENLDFITLCMKPLAYFGVNFLLDDFGSGHSSLLHLQRLPMSSVKIDLHYLLELNRSLVDRRLVSAVITFAQQLGKQLVIEGVETKEQLEWLTDLGCYQMQGYLFSEATSIDSLVETYSSNNQGVLAISSSVSC